MIKPVFNSQKCLQNVSTINTDIQFFKRKRLGFSLFLLDNKKCLYFESQIVVHKYFDVVAKYQNLFNTLEM